jgi:hypothetical protein
MLGGANTMKFVRWLLGLVALGWGLYAAMPMVFTILHKLGQSKNVPPEAQRFLALMDATPWWVVGVWALVFVVTMMAAWRLFRGGKAAVLLAIATLGNLGIWWVFHDLPVYKSTFTAAELQMDYYIIAGYVAATVIAWFTERGK